MRHIPTSTAQVDTMKRQAKRLQRNGGGKHADLLDRVARQNGYTHWHHVTLCLKQSEAQEHGDSLIAECHAIAAAEVAGKIKLIITGPESSASQPFVLMSTGVGDAWLLDPQEHRAACLVWRGERRPSPATLRSDRLEILWDGAFELLGEFFRVSTEDAEIGTRAIAGYPMDSLRNLLEKSHSFDQRVHAIFDQPDAIEITPAVAIELIRSGWDEDQVRAAAETGGRYSPARNTILFGPQSSDEDNEPSGAIRP